MEVEFEAELWEYPGEASWHFVTMPPELAEDVRELVPPGPGFGSVRVTATVGPSTWQTSLFPDTKTGSYLLPVKKAVRQANESVAGDVLHVRLVVGED